MFSTDFMPRTDDAALEQAKGALDSIGVDHPINVLSSAVIDFEVLILELTPHRAVIGDKVVSNDELNIIANILVNDFVERGRLQVPDSRKTQFSVTLPDPGDDFFLPISATYDTSFVMMMASDIGFIYFHDAIKGRLLRFLHRGPDSVAEIPSGLVTLLTEHPVYLTRRNALTGFSEQIRHNKPRSQWQVGIVEHRPHGHRELVMA